MVKALVLGSEPLGRSGEMYSVGSPTHTRSVFLETEPETLAAKDSRRRARSSRSWPERAPVRTTVLFLKTLSGVWRADGLVYSWEERPTPTFLRSSKVLRAGALWR